MQSIPRQSTFHGAEDLIPPIPTPGMSVPEIIELMAQTCFEARNVAAGARLLEQMIEERDTIWLGIAGAGVAGGMGGQVISMIESGFVDVICSTGAQVYHDLHFAFGLPVKRISPHADDDLLRKHGDTRIYDIGIRDQETLCAQDRLIRDFVEDCRAELTDTPISSWEFNYKLGLWAEEHAQYPDRSFVIAAARHGVPIFMDSLANHSIAMNLLGSELQGVEVLLSAQRDVMDSAAIAYGVQSNGFVELGGGGPKNFIQQTGPVIQHILGVDFDGAGRGLQIGTAVEREGSLSSCTFGEAVTWGKYCSADPQKLVQIWAEYSIVFPLVTGYVLDRCQARPHSKLVTHIPDMTSDLKRSYEAAR